MPKIDLAVLSNSPSAKRWKKIGSGRRAGALIPLFSVYSKNSSGIGDFDDLRLCIDWCHKTGSSILQLLPMNEVGSTFCPYDSISSFALEVAYISLDKVPGSEDRTVANGIAHLKRQFPPELGRVDYRVKKEKLKLLWKIYYGAKTPSSKEFKKFVEDNSYWITDFALFKALKYHHAGRPWYEWEEPYKDRDPAELERFSCKNKKEIGFHLWVQWLLAGQFKEARIYAESKGVLLNGDLPILISKDSADVWAHREFFKLSLASGAPPDAYCAKGQRWGMSPYSWENIAADGYRYIKEKLKTLENFYDILRIDHVVGLFRIWSIPYNDPLENAGLNGSFDPADEAIWESHGRRLLTMLLENTRMLLCGEDLGIIPKVCPDTLKEFAIPGNDVQRWVKDWKVKHDFLEPEDYRFLSVAMLSTHDTTNWAAWWENEAGTVDEELFIRKCETRGIDHGYAGERLFDKGLSRHGRLRWKEEIASSGIMIGILGKREEELKDFIELYEDTYKEKEKLWKHLNIKGKMREGCDKEIIRAAMKITLDSRSVFSIQLMVDWLSLAGGILREDPYEYRVNRPGTVSEGNWSLVMPIPLEKLLRHEICGDIKKLISDSGRS